MVSAASQLQPPLPHLSLRGRNRHNMVPCDVIRHDMKFEMSFVDNYTQIVAGVNNVQHSVTRISDTYNGWTRYSTTQYECEKGVVAEQQQSTQHGAQIHSCGTIMQQGQTIFLKQDPHVANRHECIMYTSKLLCHFVSKYILEEIYLLHLVSGEACKL